MAEFEHHRIYTTVHCLCGCVQKRRVDSMPITIARDTRELCARAARWLPLAILGSSCKDAVKRRANAKGNSTIALRINDQGGEDSGWSQLGGTLLSIPNQLSDLALLGFRGGLYFLADHGYRPAKVLWWVTLTLLVFWLCFLWPLKVVAYRAKKTSSQPQASPSEFGKLRPLGFLFLFDRMLPAYQIDDAHY